MRIIQFLNCDIKSITEQLDNVKKQNFDTLQINPVQPFIDVDGYEWWATYQPLDFSIGNIYGSKEDLIILCQEAKKRGINVVVDVVTNHLANNGANQEFIPHHDINKKIRDNKTFWKKHFKVNSFTSYKDIIEESIGLPGLNLKNEELQDIILCFLSELKDCGVSGFRFDAAKHIGLPSDGVSYFKRVKEFLDENNLFAYSEFLDGPNNLGEELRKTIYDKKNEFAELMYILTEEDSLVGDPSKKVTFVESHDTFLNEYGSTRDKSIEEIIDEYVELTKKYEHTLFYVRDGRCGQKLPNGNPDRMPYMDTSWIDNEKIRLANLNLKKETKRKESAVMKKSEKAMKLHHELSMKVHEIMLNQLDSDSPINEHIDLMLLDYNIQSMLNSMLGVIPYDSFLLDCVVSEFYRSMYYTPALNNVSYPEYSIQVLQTLKDRTINYGVVDGLEQEIEKLDNNIVTYSDNADDVEQKIKRLDKYKM